MKKALTKRIIIGVAIALALVYIVFLFITTNFMGSNSVVTETAYKTTATDVIKTTGFVVRDEVNIENESGNVLVYEALDGDKIMKNGTVATLYKNESDAVSRQKIEDLDQKIAELEKLSEIAGSVNIGIDSVNNQLNSKLVEFIGQLNQQKYLTMTETKNDLINTILEKQIITGNNTDFTSKISDLTSQKLKLESKSSDSVGSITVDESGYFVSSVDGYENSLSYKDIAKVTYTDFMNIKKSDDKSDKYIGKIIKGVNWYLVCPITKEEAVTMSHSDTNVTVSLPYAVSGDIPASVVAVNEFSTEEKAVAVLKCNFMNAALSEIRNETIDIHVGSYEGLKVSKVALHDDYVEKTVTDENGKKTTEKQKVQGVYVKYGSELIFKQVCIVYSAPDYVICSDSPDSEVLVNGETISLYDEVVIEGSDLYDGKLIN